MAKKPAASIITLGVTAKIASALATANGVVASLPEGGTKGYMRAIIAPRGSAKPELKGVAIVFQPGAKESLVAVYIRTRKDYVTAQIPASALTKENAEDTAKSIAKRLRMQSKAQEWAKVLIVLAQSDTAATAIFPLGFDPGPSTEIEIKEG